MKKIIAIAILALVALGLQAVPAKPGFRRYTQPDGKTLVLQQKGDEWGGWFESASGEKYQMDAEGYFHVLSAESARKMMRDMGERRRHSNGLRDASGQSDLTHGTRHIPVVLVQFQDVKFTIDSPKENFEALLNQDGYSGYKGSGGSGSVAEYYRDNSHNEFNPVFDVYGPVTLENNVAYYGEQVLDKDGKVIKRDIRPEIALYDACLILDSEVDFSRFDSDGDGYIDMFLFYYAGGSQAEGWNTSRIWPHQWSVQASENAQARLHSFDGKRLARYFCTSELKGSPEENTMCSIGVTCHEFAHSLGLPDFYDTDGEENGKAGGVYQFSVMCGGCYLDESRTPPFFGSLERIMLGWMDNSKLDYIEAGDHILEHVDENVAMRTVATAEGEYFIYEMRGGAKRKWDKVLSEGLAVYHVDQSKEHTIGDYTAYDLWKDWEITNMINAYGDHPCYRLVCPADPMGTNVTPQEVDGSDFVFPGSTQTSYYRSQDWQGVNGSISLWNIRVDDGKVLFTAQQEEEAELCPEITEMGYSLIGLSEDGFLLDLGAGKSLKSCVWTLDGAPCDKDVKITPGRHLITADITYADGTREILETEIEII